MDAGDWRLAMVGGAIFGLALIACAFRWFFENYLPALEKQKALKARSDVTAAPAEAARAPAVSMKEMPPAPAAAPRPMSRAEEDAALFNFPWPEKSKKNMFIWHHWKHIFPGEGQRLPSLIFVAAEVANAEAGNSDGERLEAWLGKIPPSGRFWGLLPEAANSINNLIEDVAHRYDAMSDERELLELIGQNFKTATSRSSPSLMAAQVAQLIGALWNFQSRGDAQVKGENYQAFLEEYKKFFQEKDLQGNVTGCDNLFPALLRAALLDYVEMKQGRAAV
jgi:hypothetical protein